MGQKEGQEEDDNEAEELKKDVVRQEEEFKSKATNFSFVDWGKVMYKQSFGGERIAGDMKPHYGLLEARLLFAQQLLHHLLALEIKAQDTIEEAASKSS